MKNQNKINKIIIGVLIVLTLVLGYRALTEQKRVEYYICYDRFVYNRGTPSEEDFIRYKELCKERND